MTLETQTIPISLTKGLDTQADDKNGIPGTLTELENGVFTKTGRISKRYGFTRLSNEAVGADLSPGAALGVFNNELLVFTGQNVLSYVSANENWISRGTAVSLIQEELHILTNSYQQLNPDVAYLSGLECYVWEDSRGGVRYSVVDSSTRTFLVSDGYVGGLVKPKVVPFQNNFVILGIDAGNTAIKYATIAKTGPTVISSLTSLVTDLHASNYHYDVQVLNSAKLVVVYNNNSSQLASKYLDSNMTAATFFTAVAITPSQSITCWQDGSNNLWSAGYDGSQVKYVIHTYVGSLSLGVTVSESIVASIPRMTGYVTDNGTSTLLYECLASDGYDGYIKQNIFSVGGVVSSTSIFKRSVGLASKIFEYDSNYYVNVTHESTYQSTYFTLDLDGNIIGKANALNGGGLRTKSTLSEVPATSTGNYIYANLVKGRLLSEANIVFSLLGVAATKLDFASANRFQSATSGNNFHIVGGILQMYDSVGVVESGFHLFPENVGYSKASGGSIASGTYLYRVCYEWTDNFGQIHRSVPSTPLTVTHSGTSKTTLTIPTLRLTNKSNVRLVVYRTTASGSLYYRVSSVVSPTFNDITSNSVSFEDTLADASITSNELLYTTGEILENDAPPSCSLIVSYRGRLFLAGLEDKNLLWYSKTSAENVPAEFSAFLTLRCDPRGGPITALAVLDDKLVIFKNHAIYVLSGDGPENTGAGNLFSDPELITTDAGCDNPNSIAVTPKGIIFKSSKGIYLLDRSLSVSYIGAPVRDFNSKTISSAVLVPNTNQVRLTTEEDVILVYDYYFDQWSTFTNLTSVDADVWQNNYVILNSAGRVSYENSNTFMDGSNKIKLKLTTSWLSFAGVQNFQRVKRLILLGEYIGAHNLTISMAYDYGPSATESVTVDASSNTAYGESSPYGDDVYGGEFHPYQYKVHLARQKCQAIRVTVEDDQVSNFNEGYNISNLNFEVGVKKGQNKVNPGYSLGSS